MKEEKIRQNGGEAKTEQGEKEGRRKAGRERE